jgi:hypothetical protein
MNYTYRYEPGHSDEFLREHWTEDEVEEMYERIPYELIDLLIKNSEILKYAIMELREEINALTPENEYVPYPMTASDLPGIFFDDHPAMKRYQELFGYYEPRV